MKKNGKNSLNEGDWLKGKMFSEQEVQLAVQL